MASFPRIPLLCAAFLASASLPGQALADPLVEGARQCTQQFPEQEAANGIPTHLLAAISSTESGRWHKKLGLALPWPWTINVEGKGYYFDSKAEAMAKTRAYLAQGIRSIDIGCMQVNLKHHPNAFRTLDEAFDPATNIAYGAKFLRSNYDEQGDWIKATAAYHSRTNRRGMEYLARIEQTWNRIVGKVAAARARQGMEPTEAHADGAADTVSTPRTASGRPMRPIASSRNVKVIQVGGNAAPARAPRNDVLVLRQAEAEQPAPAPAFTASVRDEAPDMMVQGRGDSVRRVTIDNQGGSSDTGGSSSSTRFVFAN